MRGPTNWRARSANSKRGRGRSSGKLTLDLRLCSAPSSRHAVQLSGTDGGAIYEYDEAAKNFTSGQPPDGRRVVDALRASRYGSGEGATDERRPPGRRCKSRTSSKSGNRRYANAPDVATAWLSVSPGGAAASRGANHGSVDGLRRKTGSFSPEVVNLLQTFATQSVLAIQNARLFREIEEKSRQIEAANRHKSEFLANMSHELRTPLNAIIGFSEVLGERMFGELNEKQAEYTDDILSSGRHLLSLINEILDLSKVEAGRMELELATFDLPLAIDNARTFVRERATKHGINLDVTVDERLGDFVGDERKIKQILLNLLSNAVKFTPEGGRIGIKARQADGSVEISVSDTGIGIAPEDQPKIFEEFRQVGADYAHKVRGRDLG